MHCKSYSHFFSKKFQHICISLNVNFNESLTNDVVSFEQLGPDFHNINAHTKFGKNPLIFTHYCLELKIRMCGGQITLPKIDKICPLAIQSQISTCTKYNINAHTKFGENPLTFTQVIILKQNTDGQQMEGWAYGHRT